MTPPREPDRYEEKAREAWNVWRLDRLIANEPNEITAAKITARVAAALRAAEASALERAAQVAKQSQEDCFCRDKADALTGGMPCTACMEAARIEGTLHGLAHRLAPPPESPPAKEPCRAEVASRFPEYSHYECELPGGHVGPHSEGGTEWTDATTVVAPPSEPVAPAPSAAEKRIAELEEAVFQNRKDREHYLAAEALLRDCDDVLARVQGHGCPPSEALISVLRYRIDAALSRTASPGKEEG